MGYAVKLQKGGKQHYVYYDFTNYGAVGGFIRKYSALNFEFVTILAKYPYSGNWTYEDDYWYINKPSAYAGSSDVVRIKQACKMYKGKSNQELMAMGTGNAHSVAFPLTFIDVPANTSYTGSTYELYFAIAIKE